MRQRGRKEEKVGGITFMYSFSDASSHQRRSTTERLSWQRTPTLFYSVHGQVIEADGLKGNLGMVGEREGK